MNNDQRIENLANRFRDLSYRAAELQNRRADDEDIEPVLREADAVLDELANIQADTPAGAAPQAQTLRLLETTLGDLSTVFTSRINEKLQRQVLAAVENAAKEAA